MLRARSYLQAGKRTGARGRHLGLHGQYAGGYLPIVKAVCPLDPRHARFETTAHVVQSWEVTPTGAFVAGLEDLETAHGPDPGNLWTCIECQSTAVVYPEDAAADRAVRLALERLELERQAGLRVEPGPRERLSGLAERLS